MGQKSKLIYKCIIHVLYEKKTRNAKKNHEHFEVNGDHLFATIYSQAIVPNTQNLSLKKCI